MKCTEARELLASDFLDGELDKDARGEVVKHLDACDGCRRFEEAVRRAAVDPLRNAPRETAPPSLWLKVRLGIEHEQERGVRAALYRVWRSFHVPWTAYAAASATAAVIIAIAVLREPLTVPGSTRASLTDTEGLHEYIEEQFSILAYQDTNGTGNGANGNGADSVNFGTLLEEYLM
ncbi:MAG: anti-sigma factor [Candidatus Aureabacteria bacterium]|nr:anti-sigma factor [Candidatus Auribacterota bacterium]